MIIEDIIYHIKDFFISIKDRHPNKLGQELLAQEFLEKYYDLYSV